MTHNYIENEHLSECGNDYRFGKLPLEGDNVLPDLVGDGGFEPPTSTMSTWRSTPELIALLHFSYNLPATFVQYCANRLALCRCCAPL